MLNSDALKATTDTLLDLVDTPEFAEFLEIWDTGIGPSTVRGFFQRLKARRLRKSILQELLVSLLDRDTDFEMQLDKVWMILEYSHSEKELPEPSRQEVLRYYKGLLYLWNANAAFRAWLRAHRLIEVFLACLPAIELNYDRCNSLRLVPGLEEVGFDATMLYDQAAADRAMRAAARLGDSPVEALAHGDEGKGIGRLGGHEAEQAGDENGASDE